MTSSDTKTQILSAALELFAICGYEKTTMRQIAKNVGIQSASIYYFFASKESLLKTILDEFEENFAKYRNAPEAIWKAAKEKPLSEALGMMFYTFGNPAERDRMLTISRVILSLQYENTDVQELLEKVMIQDALNYGVKVLKGLHSLGIIAEINFQWAAFVFHSFAIAIFQDSLRELKTFAESNRNFEEGIRFLCENFAKMIDTNPS